MAWTEVNHASSRTRVKEKASGKPVCGLSALELEREQNVKENAAFLRSLGIETIKEDMRPTSQKQQGAEHAEGGVPAKLALAEVRRKWPGRGAQIDQLAKLLPPPSCGEALPPVLLCYGPRGTGKSGVLEDLMIALEHPHAFISGREYATSRALYMAIIKAWLRHVDETGQADEVLEDVSMLDEMEKVQEDDDDEGEGDGEDMEEEEEEEGGAVDSQASQGEGGVQEGGSGVHKRSFGEVFGEHEEGSDDEEDEMEGKRGQDRDEDEDEEDDDASSASKRPIFRQQQEPMSSGYTLSSASGLLRLLERWRGLPTPFVVVLDDADQLLRECVHVLQELLELPRTLRAPCVALSVVFVSHDPMILPGGAAMALQLVVPFPSYTKAEIIVILQRLVSEAVGIGEGSGVKPLPAFQDLVRTFVNVLAASLYGSTRDVRELKRMAFLLSPHYLRPVLTSGAAAKTIDKTVLYEQIRPLLKVAIRDCLYCLDKPLEVPAVKAAPAGEKGETQTEALLRHEMPRLSHFLLVAAYLASHNAPDTDLYLFTTKNRGKRRGKRGSTEIQEEEANEEGGPRVFKLERLLCIFNSLLTAHREDGAARAVTAGDTELFIQINTLVHIRLLSRVSPAPWDLAAVKYRCHASFEVVDQVAKDLGIPLNSFLAAGSSAQ